MEAVKDLIEDIKRINEETDKAFDVFTSVNAYIPHFTCTNHFLDQKHQDDINRFVFSKEYSIQPYSGCYGDFPKKWMEKVNVISKTIEDVKASERKKLTKGK